MTLWLLNIENCNNKDPRNYIEEFLQPGPYVTNAPLPKQYIRPEFYRTYEQYMYEVEYTQQFNTIYRNIYCIDW